MPGWPPAETQARALTVSLTALIDRCILVLLVLAAVTAPLKPYPVEPFLQVTSWQQAPPGRSPMPVRGGCDCRSP